MVSSFCSIYLRRKVHSSPLKLGIPKSSFILGSDQSTQIADLDLLKNGTIGSREMHKGDLKNCNWPT